MADYHDHNIRLEIYTECGRVLIVGRIVLSLLSDPYLKLPHTMSSAEAGYEIAGFKLVPIDAGSEEEAKMNEYVRRRAPA